MQETLVQKYVFHYTSTQRITKETMVFEADLARMIKMGWARQMILEATSRGWTLKVQPTWDSRYMTLVSLRKEVRHYKDVDRLFSTIRKHGPLPPTLILGDTS